MTVASDSSRPSVGAPDQCLDTADPDLAEIVLPSSQHPSAPMVGLIGRQVPELARCETDGGSTRLLGAQSASTSAVLLNSLQVMLKRVLDRTAAAICLFLLLPLFIVAAILVKLDSPGPIIYRRQVLGVTGRSFHAFKFRTMRVGSDHLLQNSPVLWAEYQRSTKLKSDPRVTRLGRVLRRLSVDELPQLVNVLRGEMSLVGPRMIVSAELEKYGPFAAKRLLVQPGITGLWQIKGRHDPSYETRISYDMEYIDHWSLWLDIKILLSTIPAVLTMRGAC